MVAVREAPTVLSKRMARPPPAAVFSIVPLLVIVAPLVAPLKRTDWPLALTDSVEVESTSVSVSVPLMSIRAVCVTPDAIVVFGIGESSSRIAVAYLHTSGLQPREAPRPAPALLQSHAVNKQG